MHNIELTMVSRKVRRGISVLIRLVNICAVLDEQLNHIQMASDGREMERSREILFVWIFARVVVNHMLKSIGIDGKTYHLMQSNPYYDGSPQSRHVRVTYERYPSVHFPMLAAMRSNRHQYESPQMRRDAVISVQRQVLRPFMPSSTRFFLCRLERRYLNDD